MVRYYNFDKRDLPLDLNIPFFHFLFEALPRMNEQLRGYCCSFKFNINRLDHELTVENYRISNCTNIRFLYYLSSGSIS